MSKVVYTVGEVADILCFSKTKVYDMVHKSEIPYINVGKRIIIPIKQFDIWLDEKTVNNEH